MRTIEMHAQLIINGYLRQVIIEGISLDILEIQFRFEPNPKPTKKYHMQALKITPVLFQQIGCAHHERSCASSDDDDAITRRALLIRRD